jgi:ADP-heptose:LPS heptosyltransferase
MMDRIENLFLHIRAETKNETFDAAVRLEELVKNELIPAVVKITLEIGKAHWVRHGTAIKPEEAALVLSDVERLLRSSSTGTKL